MNGIENIGNVALNLKYYNGSDLYSDGDVEEKILNIVKNYDEEEYNEIIFNTRDWATMYHLSHIRQNIVGTVELNKNMHVLEIGSGCGAITGILADKAGSVTCVELSKKRSTINAYKNKNKKNIKIMVGNFQDIEKDLGQFDCVTLIGVFEYADAYIDSENPYEEFLRIIKKHLSPAGRIVMAIENKLGLKYFAGCREDHFGTFFEGIEDYTNTEGIRTFTKKELEEMFHKVGMDEYSFYYPYPDYKFPLKVFSDAYLPKIGELNSNVLNFDRDRLLLFDETKVFNTFIKEDMFPQYSNSFLIEIGSSDSKVIYKKYSNDRAEEFSICTDMAVDEDGTVKVRKSADSDKGREHIKRIIKWSELLKKQYEGSGLSVCESAEVGGKAVSEFIEGETFEEIADKYINHGEEEKAEELIKKLIAVILDKNASIDFEITPEFVKVFGEVEFEGHMHTGIVNDIDMVLNNIIVDKGTWKLIDYEWCFDFPVPAEFIIYRMLHYYLESSNTRNVLKKKNFIHLSEKDRKTFEEMERSFQNYVEGKRHPLRKMYDSFGKETLDMRAISSMLQDYREVRLYKECKEGYSEDFAISGRAVYLKELNRYAFSFEIEEGIGRYRFDPCECGCILKIEDVKTNKGPLLYHTNGMKIGEKKYIFAEDPWIEFETEGADISNVYIEYSLEKVLFKYGEDALKQLVTLIERINSDNSNLQNKIEVLEKQTEYLQTLLMNMETSASWKITKPLRTVRNIVRNNSK